MIRVCCEGRRTGSAIGFRIRWLRQAAEEAGLVLIGDFLLRGHVRCVARRIVFDVAVYEMAVGHLRAAARAIDPLCFAFPRHFCFFAFFLCSEAPRQRRGLRPRGEGLRPSPRA